MLTLNRATLAGNVGKDPEVRTFPSGGKVCNFSLATSERWRDKTTGERKERTQWHNIAIFNENLVAIAEQYIRKGSKVYVEGQIETRKWQDQNGQDRYTTEIVLRGFGGMLKLMDGAPRDGDAREPEHGGGAMPGHIPGADMSDDIPFNPAF